MKKIILLLLSISAIYLNGCMTQAKGAFGNFPTPNGISWWGYTGVIGATGCVIEIKEKQKDETEEAKIHEKYKRINTRRASIGLPPLEKPEYQREKSTLLY